MRLDRHLAPLAATLVAAVVLFAATGARATVYVEDTFDSSDGGIGWAAASSWSSTVSGGELHFTGGSQQRLFDTALTATDYWMAITWDPVGASTEASFVTTGGWEGSGGQPYFFGFDSRNSPIDAPRFPTELSGNAGPVNGLNTSLLHVYNVTGSGFNYDLWAFSGEESSVNPATLGTANWVNGGTRSTSNTTPDRWNFSGGLDTDFHRIAIADNAFEALGQAVPEISSIGLNFAGATNNPGGRKALAADVSAGAPGYEQVNWNNTPGTAQTGTPSSANDTMLNLKDASGLTSTLDVVFTSSQTWGTSFGATPTGDQMLKGNSINSNNVSVTVSEIPFETYDIIVYFSNYQGLNFNVDYTLTLEDTSVLQRFATTRLEQDGNDFPWTEVSESATNAGARETGNYTVFSGITGSSFVITATGGPGFDAIQIVDATVTVIPSPAAMPAGMILLLIGSVRRHRRARAA